MSSFLPKVEMPPPVEFKPEPTPTTDMDSDEEREEPLEPSVLREEIDASEIFEPKKNIEVEVKSEPEPEVEPDPPEIKQVKEIKSKINLHQRNNLKH